MDSWREWRVQYLEKTKLSKPTFGNWQLCWSLIFGSRYVVTTSYSGVAAMTYTIYLHSHSALYLYLEFNGAFFIHKTGQNIF